MKPSCVRFLPLLLALALPMPLAAQSRAPETIAPAETVVFIKLNPAKMRPIVEGKSPFLQEPEIRKILESLEVSPQHIQKMFSETVGVPLSDFLDVLQGPIAISLIPADPSWDDGYVFVSLGVKPGDEVSNLWSRLQERIQSKASESGAKARDEEIHGAKVWVLSPPSSGEDEDAAAGSSFETLHFCMKGEHFLFSNHRATIEKGILALDGKEVPSLASSENYKTATGRLAQAPDASLYVNLKSVMAGFAESLEGLSAMMGSEQGLLDVLGLSSVQSLAAGFTMGSQGLEMTGFLHAPGKRAGILKMLSPKAVPLTPDRLMPANAVQASIMNLDPAQLFADIKAIVASFGEEHLQKMDESLAMMEEQLGVNIDRDILKTLQAPLYSVEVPSETGTVAANQVLYYFRTNDSKRLSGALNTLLAIAGEQMEGLNEKEYLGQKILSLDVPMGMMDESAAPKPAIAVTETHFFFTLGGTEPIERALRTVGKDVDPLAGAATYQRAMAGLPEQALAIGYFKPADLWRTMKQQLQPLLDMGMAGEEGEALGALLALDPNLIRRYLDVGGFAMTSESSGFQMIWRVLAPPKKQDEPK